MLEDIVKILTVERDLSIVAILQSPSQICCFSRTINYTFSDILVRRIGIDEE
jgi:hypothetical protein